ncbi:hypothetical protein CCE28_17965 [Anaeromicrobium sediminis]|uniref:Uncharacterized protein n=2 Tax=Anaeromicrobium sediminis TaxID=1478221 RepID=A0A267MGG6_9FIRM|nr:hypothetical protein CCE28_17965 [Anaeromicrobium sediminis]
MIDKEILLDLTKGLIHNYGLISIDDFSHILKSRYGLDIPKRDSLTKILEDFSHDNDLFNVKDDYIYIDEIRDYNYLKDLQEEHGDLDYKHISYMEVIESSKLGRPLNKFYKKLYNYLKNTFGIATSKLPQTIEFLSYNFQLEMPLHELVQYLIEFSSTKRINDQTEILSLLGDFLEELPQWSLKGFSVNDLKKKDENKDKGTFGIITSLHG